MIPVILALAVGCCDQIEIGPSSEASKILESDGANLGDDLKSLFSRLKEKKFLLVRISDCESLTNSQIESVQSVFEDGFFENSIQDFCKTKNTISDFDFFYVVSGENDFSIYFQHPETKFSLIFLPFIESSNFITGSIGASSECGVKSNLIFGFGRLLYSEDEINCVEEEDDGLSAGEIAGIAVGSVIGAGLLGYLLYRCWNRRSQDGNLLQSVL